MRGGENLSFPFLNDNCCGRREEIQLNVSWWEHKQRRPSERERERE